MRVVRPFRRWPEWMQELLPWVGVVLVGMALRRLVGCALDWLTRQF